MKVIIMPEAHADMLRIAEFIAQNNPARALSILVELRRQCARLREMPGRFPLVPRFENSGIRRCVHGNYLIFYRVTDVEVEVLHVFHGAMDYEQLLFPRS